MDVEAQKEIDYLNNEILMRMQKAYGDGAMLVSFSLIYFATIIGVLLNLIEVSTPNLINICIFGVLSIIFFFLPIRIFYSISTHNRECLSGILNIAAYKRTYYENFTINDRTLLGGRWENFHKDTISSYFSKSHTEVFLLSCLSFFLYLCGFVLTDYCAFGYRQHDFSMILLITLILINIIYVVCLIWAIKLITHLHFIYNPSDVSGEFMSIAAYYDIQYKITQVAKNDDELKELIGKLKNENRKFMHFLAVKHILLYKAIELEKCFYNEAFNKDGIVVKGKIDESDKKIQYIRKLANKKGVTVYNFISSF